MVLGCRFLMLKLISSVPISSIGPDIKDIKLLEEFQSNDLLSYEDPAIMGMYSSDCFL
jgi:hypothetical protein